MPSKRSPSLRLYSPLWILVLTLLFTPFFGAFLHGLNWRELEEPELAAKSMGWVRMTFLTFVLYLFVEPFIRDIPASRYLLAALIFGFWLSWALSLGIKQVRYVKEHSLEGLTLIPLGRAIMLGAFGWVAYTSVTLTLNLLLHLMGVIPLALDSPLLQP